MKVKLDHTRPLCKYALRIEYDGTAYCGWQRQQEVLSVQQVVEEAVGRMTGEEIVLWGASRTDAGVHARGQVAHFLSRTSIPPSRMMLAFNTVLPDDVRVVGASAVPDGFHAQYDAQSKIYRYVFFNARYASAMERLYTAHAPVVMDDGLMNEAAQIMLGKQDFAAFAASGSRVKTTVRTIYAVKVEREGQHVVLTIHGSGFLYNMVRILAGTLHDIGIGKMPAVQLSAAIGQKDRLLLGITAPPQGLTLERIFYPIPLFDGL